MEPLEIAQQFAKALDMGDYEAVAALLTPDCRYDFRGTMPQGRTTIMAMYRDNDDWAKRTFDEIEYGSEVALGADRHPVITFSDYTRHDGIKHTHTCRQSLNLDAEGGICGIRHIDMDGERAGLDAFLARCGITRPGVGDT